MKILGLRLLVGGALLLALCSAARAEAKEVRFARQLGLGYLQFYVMQEKRFLEGQAERRGLGKVTATYAGMGTPTAITDALLSGNVDVIGIGLPAFLTMWDKTRGSMDVRGIVAMNRQPAYLNTRNPNIKSLRDFTDSDRIALPAPKVSVQAIMLQMLAEKIFGPGKFDALDRLTVGMSHPDGTAAMLTGKLEVTSHFTSAPFQYQQLENPAIRKLVSSYDATDGPNTFSAVATVGRWREANPQLYRAVHAAILEANDFIAANPREAAEIFTRIENSKLPAGFIEKLIRDPEFSYAPEPRNVMKIYAFMNRVGALKTMPSSWKDLFFPEAHELQGD
ncbi:MAG: sulfonate transport system substrate-binding protein [Hyphomicrobiales bacterium]|jgi:NitT/TauT family transport system substrate-binding protein|nr:sulfonate transport system substrate-binding protein [Hyphomicrobiales bacterium]